MGINGPLFDDIVIARECARARVNSRSKKGENGERQDRGPFFVHHHHCVCTVDVGVGG